METRARHEGHEQGWYATSYAAVRRRFADPELYVDLLALTSARASVGANVTLATKAYRQIKEHGCVMREGFTRHHYASIKHYLETGNIRGRKTGSFAECLRNPESQRVPVDIWMMRWHGLDHNVPTKKEYDEIESRILTEAAEHGMTPRDYQSKVWMDARGDGYRARGSSFADYLQQEVLMPE
jgi:hypothetical protein